MNKADRACAASLLRRWLDGAITNYEIDDAWPWQSDDLAVVDIGAATWCYYDDFPKRVLHPSDLTPDERATIERCLEYLTSALPYLIPERVSEPEGFIRRFMRKRGWFKGEACLTKFRIADNRMECWPFEDESQSRSRMIRNHP